MPSVILVGAQWGDEGKGKIIDILTADAQHVVRSQGGNNAGHTILIGQEEYKLHLIPSGILHPHPKCYLGAGMVIDPEVLIQEIDLLQKRNIKVEGRLLISPAAHVIFPYHKLLDTLFERSKGERSIGTTGRGIGPCYSDKASRLGIRIGEYVRPDIFPKILKSVLQLKNEELTRLFGAEKIAYEKLLQDSQILAKRLLAYVAPVEALLDEALKNDENVLLEGAQGTFLDLSLGTYPYVTSSNTIAGGICAGAGIGPSQINHTLGVMKAYTTRVGNGPLPTEVLGDEIFIDHQSAREYGTTTGRKRRLGWFDAVLAKTAICYNGLQSIALTKLDVLDSLAEIKVCVGYKLRETIISYVPPLTEDLEIVTPIYETLPGWQCSTKEITHFDQLPQKAINYIQFIENLCGIPISMVSLGPQRERTLILTEPFQSIKAAR